MDDVQRALSQEVARIIACPYPASLTPLADLLARADDRMVQACVHHLPQCAIARLASIVASSLSLWSYSLPILHAFCHSSEFRDSLLKHDPCLLDSLLAKANASQREFDQYTELCVLLLSRPLPAGVSLPSSAQPFFLRLFDRATQISDATSLKHVYFCLNGACGRLLELLSSKARHEFDERLCHLLQLHSAGQDSLLLLWCYGIIILAGVPEALLCQSDQSTNFAKQWKTTSARRLFETPKGLKKSIDLNFISVIWVMKEEVGVSDEDAIEGIKIATRAMRLVDESTKAKWLKSTDIARQSVAKLADKILRSGMNPCVRFAGLCFYATMTGGNDLPEELVTEYESLLLRLKELESDPEALRETLESSLPLYAPRVQESTIRQLLVKILESSTSSKHSSELRNTGILVGVLMNAATGSLSRLLPSALCSNEMQEHLHLFLSATIESSEPVETCDSSLNLSRRDLYTNTISMLLTSLLAAGTTHYQSAPAIGVALINKQRKLAPFHKPCSHLKPSSPPTISFFEQGCTPASGIHRQDWRDSLGSELERQSYYQRDSVIRSVAQICQNLEDRCNSVEGPLRQEQAKVKELTLVVSQLRKQVADMETDAIDRQCISNGLEAEIENANKENDDLAAKLEELEAETENANRGKDDLTAKLAELRATFDRANKEADESLLKAQEDLRTQEVVFRSTISAQEESLRSRDRQIGELDAQKEGLEDQLRALESEKVSLGELYSTLKAELDAAYQNLQIELENTTRQAGEIGQLNARQSDLEDRLANTKEKLEDTLDEQKEMAQKIDQLNDTRSSLENQLTSAKQQLEDTLNERSELQVRVKESEQALRDMEIKHANQLDAVTLKASDELGRLRGKLQDAYNESNYAKATCETMTRNLEIVQATVNRLENQVQQLTDVCAEKDDELYELKAWRVQMKALAMGSSSGEPVSRRTKRESGTRKSSVNTAGRHHKRKSEMQPDDIAAPIGTVGLQGFTNTAIEDVANASFRSSDFFERNGSTPKRAKIRQSFKASDMRTPHKQKPNVARPFGTKHIQRRAALETISPNRRHTTVGFAVARDEEEDEEMDTKRRGSLQFGTQASFDMDKLLASSPFTPGRITCGTGKDPGEEELDDGTLEL